VCICELEGGGEYDRHLPRKAKLIEAPLNVDKCEMCPKYGPIPIKVCTISILWNQPDFLVSLIILRAALFNGVNVSVQIVFN
jgi:hypothetical protein